nr:MAG TPA: putative cellulose synthase A [Caudoviricetes sp.]
MRALVAKLSVVLVAKLLKFCAHWLPFWYIF